jgi:hypothetical protein
MRLFASPASKLPLILAAFALSTAACGDKGGDDDPATGGSNGGPSVETVFAFDSTIDGFKFEDYAPGDPMYVNIYHVDPANAVLAWDGGDGSDGEPGRLKLTMNFSDWNQLADIQVNFMGENVKDWAGKIIRSRVMMETGFSSNPSCPGGGYIFLKTSLDYTWSRGATANLEGMTAGQWVTFGFIADSPGEVDTASPSAYDPTQVLSIGMQFYSSSGSGCSELPEEAVVYVDTFTIEDAG